MSGIENIRWLSRLGFASLVLFLAATGMATAEPSTLPPLKPVTVEVDTTGLPNSERAALVPLIRAARQIDAVYIRQVWPRTPVLIGERRAAQTGSAQAELAA
ncbi:MAG TPA: hypothetical protein VGI23_25805, partial [Steroidobacteraceae bacterium]